jgi:glutamate dehydrogenase
MQTVRTTEHPYPLKDIEAATLAHAPTPIRRDGALEGAFNAFISQVYDDAIADDLEGVSVATLGRLVAKFWQWANDLKPGRSKVRIEVGERADGSRLNRDIIEIITADKPFLVDSIMGEINAQGIEILAMFHPVVTVPRDGEGRRVAEGDLRSESMIQVHIEPLGTQAQEDLLAGIRAALSDVEVVVADHDDMLARMDQAIAELRDAPINCSREELDECLAFLQWMRNDQFAFLGCRVYEFATDQSGHLVQDEPIIFEETGRGVLRDPDRNVLRRGSEPAILTPAIQEFLKEPSPLIVAKANMRSRVHRRVYMDYIGVKRYRSDGEVLGETRFVGLFTASAYLERASQIPLIRRKVNRVIERAGRLPGSHNAKQLRHIVETYPRDELFQAEEAALMEISMGILHLSDRPRAKLFIRRDRFDRFASIFVFVPRERFNSQLRIAIANMLVDAFNGRLSAFYPSFNDGPLARIHFIIGLDPFDHPEPDIAVLERRLIELSRTWDDDFQRQARAHATDALRPRLKWYDGAFPLSYQELYAPKEATIDAAEIEQLSDDQDLRVRAFQNPGDQPGELHLKVYRQGRPVALSDVLPALENMGAHIRGEDAHIIRRTETTDRAERRTIPTVHLHDFHMEFAGLGKADTGHLRALEEAVIATWQGRNENDGFNRLIASLGIGWRDVAYLRCCARYRQQTGLDPSQAVQEAAFSAHPDIVRLILELRTVRLAPDFDGDRAVEADRIREAIHSALDAVSSLDHDRVLRRIAELVAHTLRTNFYQRDDQGKPLTAISIKIDSGKITELPQPKPFREIFVWAPHVEGVHLRFGPVARGGLRWSDRRDDFRTEVLGLVKAQVVKNAVIVPVGSKGGFYPKQLPVGGSREAVFAEGTRAYTTFVSALLDVTDNIVDGGVVKPARVVCHDGDDPYLVVAADKGTATLSDTANGIAKAYGFWLGDAFASGGSAGYDHKKMGITARGAWVAVQRHFRELGKDIQNEPFTVIGCGDMSGDVFGNGMLLSRQIRLIAAFDHRDIFIDPNPEDLDAAFAERQRMFQLPRSSWQDYSTHLLSKGGGVFQRSLKTIPLSTEIKELTGIKADSATPSELIHALLKAEVELLWFGGIGTYIKADEETHYDVGDRANDGLRVSASQVRAKVIGEGANLGITQRGRIGMSRLGVKLNADFIDNSGGVDSSDHEVNIKILLNPMMQSGEMTEKDRNILLESMTEEVADHVLTHNYDQSLAISMAVRTAADDLDAHERLIERLEARGKLNRTVENLPTAEQFRDLKARKLGLTRPEIALLVSHSKISLFGRILSSKIADDPFLNESFYQYFPEPLQHLREKMDEHRLKREIVATVLANLMVNVGGPTFAHRARESTGGDTEAVCRGFIAAQALFDFPALMDEIQALDNVVPTDTQMTLYSEIVSLLRRQTYWLVRKRFTGVVAPLGEVVEAYKPGVDVLRSAALDVVASYERKQVDKLTESFRKGGAPDGLAHKVAVLRTMMAATDVIDLARQVSWPLQGTARLYHGIGQMFHFDQLRMGARTLLSEEHWDRLAARRLVEDLYGEQQQLCRAVINHLITMGIDAEAMQAADASDLLDRFVTAHEVDADRARDTVKQVRQSSAGWTLAKLTIASTALREFGVSLQEAAPA